MSEESGTVVHRIGRITDRAILVVAIVLLAMPIPATALTFWHITATDKWGHLSAQFLFIILVPVCLGSSFALVELVRGVMRDD